jgi:hypothetical protein
MNSPNRLQGGTTTTVSVALSVVLTVTAALALYSIIWHGLYLFFFVLFISGTRVARWLFSNQKSQFEEILEGLALENLGIFYDNLDYFRAIRNILSPFGKVVVIGYIFPRFGILDQEKSGNPVRNLQTSNKSAVDFFIRISAEKNFQIVFFP